MNLIKRVRNLWWLSGQDFTYETSGVKKLVLKFTRRPAQIVETENVLDKINLQ